MSSADSEHIQSSMVRSSNTKGDRPGGAAGKCGRAADAGLARQELAAGPARRAERLSTAWITATGMAVNEAVQHYTIGQDGSPKCTCSADSRKYEALSTKKNCRYPLLWNPRRGSTDAAATPKKIRFDQYTTAHKATVNHESQS